MSSINSITDQFGEKLSLYTKDITVNQKIKGEQIECTEITVSDQVSASDVASSTGSFSILNVNDTLNVATIKSIYDVSWSDASDVVFTSSFPAGFVTSISGVTYASQRSQKWDPDQSLYVQTLKIRVRSECAVGLPAAEFPAGFYITVNNIPEEFHNAALQYGTAVFQNAGGLNGTGFGLYGVDTTVIGKITFGCVNNQHLEVTAGLTILNAEIEVRSTIV